MVREQLQDEFLRLQGELGKTIVFVTHDIDEAIKLGDQVAVLRVGGKLAQLATPAELLSRPADAFVAGFVGRDRGYRALGFAEAGQLPLTDEAGRRAGRHAAARRRPRRATAGCWSSTTTGSRRAGSRSGGLADGALAARSTPDLLNLGGTLATRVGTLRAALDAALSSPSGRGVIVRRGRPVRRHGHAARGARAASRRAPPRSAATGSNAAGRSTTAAARDTLALLPRPPSEILSWLWTTVWLAACRSLVGLVIALPIGWFASRYRWTYPPIVVGRPACSTRSRRSCCSSCCPGILGTRILDPINVAVALTVYTVALLVRVVADGLDVGAPADTCRRRGDGLHRAAAIVRRPAAASRCR